MLLEKIACKKYGKQFSMPYPTSPSNESFYDFLRDLGRTFPKGVLLLVKVPVSCLRPKTKVLEGCSQLACARRFLRLERVP